METKKKYITLLLLVILLLLSSGFYFMKSNVFRCDSEQVVDIKTGGIDATMDAIISIFINPNGTGIIKYTGYIQVGGENYELNRLMNFNYTKVSFDSLYEMEISNDVVNKNDTTPSELFHSYFLPAQISKKFILEIYKLDKNAILVRGVTYPYFVCAKDVKR